MTRNPPASLRHHWVHVRADAFGIVAATCTQPVHRAAVDTWLAAGHPLILRSARTGDRPGHLAAGLALPPRQGKARIALCVPEEAVAAIEEPPTLALVADALDPPFAQLARRLAAASQRIGFVPRTFGSAAWQWRSGHAYMTTGSDLDVLAAPPDHATLAEWIACLEAAEGESGVRIDGEIQAPGGLAVHWREWSGSAAQVLVKHDAGARLLARAEWEAAWIS